MSQVHSPKTNKRRVVVTGIGAVTPLGPTFRDTWNGLVEGRVPAAKVARFDASEFPCKIAYEVRDFRFNEALIEPREEGYVNTAAKYALNAVDEALCDAGLAKDREALDPTRTGVCLGIGMMSPDVDWYERVFIPKLWSDPSLGRHIRFFPDQVSAIIARLAGAKGEITTIHTACASSGQSLGEAYEQIAFGDADVIVTGGADSMISPFYLAGFSLLGALSKRNDDPKSASRPFDKDRDGFVLGEGACILIFEELEHALKRGRKPIAEVCGYGITESAYRITDLHPEGTGPIEAMQMAIESAGLRPEQIGYVNAHGTSTGLNDRIEALAVSKVFSGPKCNVKVSSSKCMTGHMISAAGAIEFAIAVQAVKHQVLPPSINVFTKDPEVLVELTESVPTDCDLAYALSNSVGFGGSNTALIAGRMPR